MIRSSPRLFRYEARGRRLDVERAVDGLLVTTGWGTWGFKAIPAGGEAMAALIATGEVPSLIAPFGLDRFLNDRTLSDRGSAGTQ